MKRNFRRIAACITAFLMLGAASSSYAVKNGDTLSAIANEFDTSVTAIVEANGISNPNRIYVGQELVIPGADSYIVQPGDTLEKVATKTWTTVAVLAEANGITNPDLLYVGTQLQLAIPAHTFEADTGSATTYVVQAGDTVGGIAARHKTTVSSVVELNRIANPNLIRIGSTLVINGAGWLCPVEGGTFFNDWGFPRSGGRFHEGNDIFAPHGTPIVAPVSGTLLQVVGDIGGYQFNLEGDDGNLYIGSHMDRFATDGYVQTGDVIGYVGDSGNAKGSRPHLHFEIHADGENPVNPYPTLAEACG
ncbi:MAG: M23 family metallopeptidase [Acidimicrobiia bacterium]|nr:M23 family metallopeptidase [Acidimicrobiia bacterium]MDH3398005.1 M23 family metallopeptidase [Acidimicrobiia bacterium]